MSVFVFIINYVVVFPMFCFTCLPIYPDKMTSWSSLKISDGAQKQFQRIKKSLLPKTRKEGQCFLQAKTVPHLPRFFYYGTDLIYFKFSLILSLYSAGGVAVRKGFHFGNRNHIVIALDRMFQTTRRNSEFDCFLRVITV